MTLPSPPHPLPPHPGQAAQVLQAILRTHLPGFIHKSFLTLNPGAVFKPNWRLDAIAYALNGVMAGTIRRLIITMPPRSLMSISASVARPAFIHGHDPSKHIICVSYAQDLAVKLQNDYRALLASPWYQAAFPGTRIGEWKDSQNEVMLTRRGARLATSIGGTLTGRGADIIVIDDPLKPIDAMSEPRRSATNEWFSTTLVSRLNDKETGAIIVVTQRLHAYDLVGHILETSPEGWTVLNLPAIAFADAEIPIGDGRFYRRKADDVLHPERESREALDNLRRDLGTEAFCAQYLQSPVPPGGALFQRRWLQRYDELPERDADSRIIQSWDCAAKTGVLNDYSVCTTWLLAKGRYFLLDVIRGRFDFPTLRQRAIEAAQAYRPRVVLVEDIGVGTGLIEELKRARFRCPRRARTL